MNPRKTIILMALALGLAGSARAGDKPIVALFDMEDKGSGLGKETIGNLIDYLSARMTECGYSIIPRDQIHKRIQEQKKDSYKACYDMSCQVELGRELAAQKTLSTKILKLGDSCSVTAELYDLKKSATESAATEEAACEVNKLVEAVKKISQKLCKNLAGEGSPAPVKGPMSPGLTPQERLLEAARGGTGGVAATHVVANAVVYGADINETVDEQGRTALILSVLAKKRKLVEYLLSGDLSRVGDPIDIQVRDKAGKTALDHARETNQPRMVKMLEEFKPTPKETGSKNGCASAGSGNSTLVFLLLGLGFLAIRRA
jgi:hypothetical protein